MQSSGRGEESPEAYRGVSHPAGQNQPPLVYGEQVQPSGGSPWGAPGAALIPEPADATQMLPPYPAGLPAPNSGHGPGAAQGHGPGSAVPVADATQMLPPYPGGDPSTQYTGRPGPVPPLPPVPPQAPQQAPQAQHQSQQAQNHGQPPVAPAEATQALPLSIFHDDQSYEQRPFPEQPFPQHAAQGYQQQPPYESGYGQQQYGTPPYDGTQEYGGGYDEQQSGPTPNPQHDSDYDHLYRSDVPSPPPIRQRIIAPPAQQQVGQPGQPSQPGQQQPYGQQPGPYEPGYDDGGSGRRMSPKVLIGIVVAGIVVAGVVVGGLLSSGGGNAAAKNTASTGPSASASGTGTAAAGGGADAAAKQQAQALNALLDTSGSSRTSVVGAVGSVKACTDLAGASGKLRAAATQRAGLVTQLGTLAVDKLPNHAQLIAALTKAWQASAAADGHYANWADQAGQQPDVCKGGHAHNTSETAAGDRESGTATQQKKHAVKLWNSIATKYGLPTRQFSQL
jgi:hypothetical protein